MAGVLRKLEVKQLAIPVTMGLFDNHILVDPSMAEEEALQGVVTVVFALPSGTISYLHQVLQKVNCHDQSMYFVIIDTHFFGAFFSFQSAREGCISRAQLETAVETARSKALALYKKLSPQLKLV